MLVDPGLAPAGVSTTTYNLVEMRNNVVRWDAAPFFQELPERRLQLVLEIMVVPR